MRLVIAVNGTHQSRSEIWLKRSKTLLELQYCFCGERMTWLGGSSQEQGKWSDMILFILSTIHSSCLHWLVGIGVYWGSVLETHGFPVWAWWGEEVSWNAQRNEPSRNTPKCLDRHFRYWLNHPETQFYFRFIINRRRSKMYSWTSDHKANSNIVIR